MGGFGCVILNYWAKKGTPAIFTARREEEIPDITYLSLTVDAIVDCNYEFEFMDLNNERTEYLGYTVEYRMTAETHRDEEQALTVYDYELYAFMDTGAERLMIHYTKLKYL